VLAFVWLRQRNAPLALPFSQPAAPTVTKQPVDFQTRSFDPANPPPEMPPLPPGELAECDSNFLSNASVGGQSRQVDATHALVTITKVDVALQLEVTIWVPFGVSEHVMEHENGHRQISEHYYETADQLAARIAAPYIGKRMEIAGDDLHAEFSKLLQEMGAEITAEYDNELRSREAQLRYDAITDHSRNDVAADEAVHQAIQEIASASSEPLPNAEAPEN
jgi:hypothetical protein